MVVLIGTSQTHVVFVSHFQLVQMAFLDLTVARCLTARMSLLGITLTEHASACLAGWDPDVTSLVREIDMDQAAGKFAIVRMEHAVIMRRGHVCAQQNGEAQPARKLVLLVSLGSSVRDDAIVSTATPAITRLGCVTVKEGGEDNSVINLVCQAHMERSVTKSVSALEGMKSATLSRARVAACQVTTESAATFPLKGCPPGTYGSYCWRRCKCLNGGHCDSETGACNCLPGFIGADCGKMCPEGRFGPHCLRKCMCKNNGICDPVNGTCICGLGWTGNYCEKECAPEKYGSNCQLDCTCQNNGTCNRFTGCCQCTDGYYGHSCEHTCPSGFYGPNCHYLCTCKNGATCLTATGQCICPPGFQGAQCEKGELGSFSTPSANVFFFFQLVQLGNLGTNVSTSVTVKGQLIANQLLESACAHLVGLGPSVTWNAEPMNTALIVLSHASAPTNPSVVHAMGDALVSTSGWDQLVKKVALQDFLLMKDKLRKEGMHCQDCPNRNTWTNK
ncbi:hypothetical protein lerEdw1_017010 [Lerista edwardsae]|nr:hypothetical protein lerEdw1_017010 [Lerista edwardsae]